MTITRVGDKILVKSEDGTVWLMQAIRRVSSEEQLFTEWQSMQGGTDEDPDR